MADFRTSVASLGFEDVTTYIQSGNVVFRSDHDDEETIAERLRHVLIDRHGLAVPVVVRPASTLAGLPDRHRFADGVVDPKLLHVAFLDRAPDPPVEPEPDRWAPDRWALDGRELFLAYPEGSARSKMTIEQFERLWKVTATARNLNTVSKLALMAASMVTADRAGGSSPTG